MTRKLFFKIAGVLGLSGLLSFGPGQAQQEQVSKTQAHGGAVESNAAPPENASPDAARTSGRAGRCRTRQRAACLA